MIWLISREVDPSPPRPQCFLKEKLNVNKTKHTLFQQSTNYIKCLLCTHLVSLVSFFCLNEHSCLPCTQKNPKTTTTTKIPSTRVCKTMHRLTVIVL